MDIDGSNVHQITNELGYDGGSFFSPDSKHLVFRASHPKTDEEPMFSPNGKKLVWSSNRDNWGTRDTNLFLADWTD
jgi:Tol biopolymer transport system component